MYDYTAMFVELLCFSTALQPKLHCCVPLCWHTFNLFQYISVVLDVSEISQQIKYTFLYLFCSICACNFLNSYSLQSTNFIVARSLLR